MHDGDEQRAGWAEHAPHFRHRGRNILDIHEHIIGHDEIEAGGFERQGVCGGNFVAISRIGAPGSGNERRHRVRRGYAMAAFLEEPGDPAFAATDFQRFARAPCTLR